MARRRAKKKKPEGWRGEPRRHALAAQGFETVSEKRLRPDARALRALLERVRVKMDRLVDAVLRMEKSGWQPGPRMFALYERNIEDMLVMLETGLGPENLAVMTPGATVGKYLAQARERYERSFSLTPTERFAELEATREEIHGAMHELVEHRRIVVRPPRSAHP